jgi:hypothetical protein
MDKKEEAKKEGIHMFSDGIADRHEREGYITADYPAWYFGEGRQMEDLRKEIKDLGSALDVGAVSAEDVVRRTEDLADMKARLADIENSKPVFTGKDEVDLAKLRKDIGQKIGQALFTYDDMMRGTADAREEARRMKQPCIKLTKEQQALAINCEMNVSKDGKISRDDASRIYQMASKLLGESGMVENLRKEKRRR